MIKVTLQVEGLDGMDEYPSAVAVTAILPRDLNVRDLEQRLVDLSRSLMLSMTYGPELVARSFGGRDV